MRHLEDVYSTILFKDLVQRNGIRETELLERIMSYVFAEIGYPFLAKSIADYLRSEHRKASVDTVYAYLNAAEKACLSIASPAKTLSASARSNSTRSSTPPTADCARLLEEVRDNHPKHVLTLDRFSRERNGIKSENLIDWLLEDW